MNNRFPLLRYSVILWCIVAPHIPLRGSNTRAQQQGLLTQACANSTTSNAQQIADSFNAAIDATQPTEQMTVPKIIQKPSEAKTSMPSKPSSIAEKKEAKKPLAKAQDKDKQNKDKSEKPPTETPKKSFAPDFGEDKLPFIEFHFENTDLQNLVNQISEIYHVTFIPDDAIAPLPAGAKTLKGNKISFKTQKPLTKKEAWDLFLTFLDLAGLTLVQQADPTQYRITGTEAAQRSSIKSYIGVDPDTLASNDEIIRYVYFVENISLDSMKNIVDSLRNSSALFQVLHESKAFILTDKSYNIKMLMQIIKELDKVTMPQSLSVLKLRKTDAKQVKELYDSIAGKEESVTARLFPTRKQPTSLYFPENTKIFAEPRTNTLILLGPKDSIAKIQDFITKYIDVDPDLPYSPLNVYPLKYADAETIAQIMTSVTEFGKNTPAGQSGGVRGIDKYLKPMSFIPEKETNRLIIRGDYEDYLRAVEIIKKLDEPQPQVAMEFLILSVDLSDNRELGSQIRSAVPGINGLVGNNVNYQTSGLLAGGPPQGIVENPNGTGATRLLGDLINLVTGKGPGNTIITLGNDQFGVWGIFQALQIFSNTQLVSNPFVTALNKTQATVTVGEIRRVVTATVISVTNSQSMGDDAANLVVKVTPQINNDGLIILDLNIELTDFTSLDPTMPNKITRSVVTKATVGDKEILAIGGLVRNRLTETTSQTPILGSIPIIGWLFKNKSKVMENDNLLILMNARIIPPDTTKFMEAYTNQHVNNYHEMLDIMRLPVGTHDPVHTLFFEGKENSPEKLMDNFIFKKNATIYHQEAQSKEDDVIYNRRKRKKLKQLAREQLKDLQKKLDQPKGTAA